MKITVEIDPLTLILVVLHLVSSFGRIFHGMPSVAKFHTSTPAL